MPRPKAVIKKKEVQIQIEEGLLAELDLRLWSKVDGRVPYGARSDFINQILREKLRDLCAKAVQG